MRCNRHEPVKTGRFAPKGHHLFLPFIQHNVPPLPFTPLTVLLLSTLFGLTPGARCPIFDTAALGNHCTTPTNSSSGRIAMLRDLELPSLTLAGGNGSNCREAV